MVRADSARVVVEGPEVLDDRADDRPLSHFSHPFAFASLSVLTAAEVLRSRGPDHRSLRPRVAGDTRLLFAPVSEKSCRSSSRYLLISRGDLHLARTSPLARNVSEDSTQPSRKLDVCATHAALVFPLPPQTQDWMAATLRLSETG